MAAKARSVDDGFMMIRGFNGMFGVFNWVFTIFQIVGTRKQRCKGLIGMAKYTQQATTSVKNKGRDISARSKTAHKSILKSRCAWELLL